MELREGEEVGAMAILFSSSVDEGEHHEGP